MKDMLCSLACKGCMACCSCGYTKQKNGAKTSKNKAQKRASKITGKGSDTVVAGKRNLQKPQLVGNGPAMLLLFTQENKSLIKT